MTWREREGGDRVREGGKERGGWGGRRKEREGEEIEKGGGG